jgi:hypothetical protein
MDGNNQVALSVDDIAAWKKHLRGGDAEFVLLLCQPPKATDHCR